MSGATGDRPLRALGLFGLVLAAALVGGLGLGAAVGPVQPPGTGSGAMSHP
ncbi:hypothetical protein [Pseudokineococcus sp. 1T1Z-3]|uniref:hypothetical protein n=1 Tax=Pseudokineococcus sp. 1T1Z-3 TaxID=3132745 RepID=UPI0030B3175B